MADFKPIARKKASEQVAEQIRKSIIQGILRPGQRLPSERDLAAQFEVTRTTLREALKKLESLKLIFIRHGDRATVLDYMRHGSLDLLGDLISRRDRVNLGLLENVMEARIAIGAEVARLAALRRDEDDLLDLDEAMARLEGAVADEAAFRAQEFECFHALATAAHNLVFVLLLNSIRKLYLGNADYFAPLLADPDAVVASHRAIQRAVIAQDADAAEAHARQFLGDGLERILDARAAAAEAESTRESDAAPSLGERLRRAGRRRPRDRSPDGTG